jgi:hypothetical protein
MRNPNQFEERDRRHIPAYVTASRVAAIFLFPLCVIGAITVFIVHGNRFAALDRGLTSRFADEVTTQLNPKEQPTMATGRTYLLGANWLDRHVMLSAQRQQLPLVLLSPDRAGDRAYLAAMREHLLNDPLLGDADRLRLVHLLEYNFLVFIQDFFVSQPNVADLAASLGWPTCGMRQSCARWPRVCSTSASRKRRRWPNKPWRK